MYSGDISSPEGDTLKIGYNSLHIPIHLIASLECKNENLIQVRILENGQPTHLQLFCNESGKPLAVKAGSGYIIDV